RRHSRQAGTDATASAPVRARLRSGSACRNRAGPHYRRANTGQGAGRHIDRRNRAPPRPSLIARKRPFGLSAAAWHFENPDSAGHERTMPAAPHEPIDPPLAADFAPALAADWRKLVDGVLKGAPFERLVGKTYDGLRIEPIYTRSEERRVGEE